jgi:hypothetical protein
VLPRWRPCWSWRGDTRTWAAAGDALLGADIDEQQRPAGEIPHPGSQLPPLRRRPMPTDTSSREHLMDDVAWLPMARPAGTSSDGGSERFTA